MKRTRWFSVAFTAMFPVLALSVANGCGNKKDDDTTPTASAPPPPAPAATSAAPANVMPEEPDAGADAGDAGADAGHVVHGGGSYTSIARCCAALHQNAKSAPPEQMGGYMAAAQACEGLKNTPVARQAFAQIRMFLAGAKMPAACQ
ncbi:MAG TPA: acyltransferase [Minicystis sp.]|nr:acyltransferase [Minicystis sp.]